MALAGSMALHHLAQFVQVHLQVAQDLHGIAFTLADQAQQDVFDADVVVPSRRPPRG
jgi:hypothetical protein